MREWAMLRLIWTLAVFFRSLHPKRLYRLFHIWRPITAPRFAHTSCEPRVFPRSEEERQAGHEREARSNFAHPLSFDVVGEEKAAARRWFEEQSECERTRRRREDGAPPSSGPLRRGGKKANRKVQVGGGNWFRLVPSLEMCPLRITIHSLIYFMHLCLFCTAVVPSNVRKKVVNVVF